MTKLLRDVMWPQVVTLALAVGSFVLLLLAVATPYWIHIRVGNSEGYQGIWDSCIKTDGDENCVDFVTEEDAFPVSKVFLFLALVLLLAAIVCCVLRVFKLRGHTVLFFGIISVLVTTGVFAMIGLSLYAHVVRDSIGNYHFSFAFMVISCLLANLGAAVLLIELRCASRSEVHNSDAQKTESMYRKDDDCSSSSSSSSSSASSSKSSLRSTDDIPGDNKVENKRSIGFCGCCFGSGQRKQGQLKGEENKELEEVKQTTYERDVKSGVIQHSTNGVISVHMVNEDKGGDEKRKEAEGVQNNDQSAIEASSGEHWQTVEFRNEADRHVEETIHK